MSPRRGDVSNMVAPHSSAVSSATDTLEGRARRRPGLDVSVLYNRGYDHVGIINTNLGAPGTANINGGGVVRPDPAFVNKSFYTNYGEMTARRATG